MNDYEFDRERDAQVAVDEDGDEASIVRSTGSGPNVADFENNIVPHEQLNDTLEIVRKFVVERSRPSADGKRAKARVLAIVGGSGSGKSTVLDMLQAAGSSRQMRDEDRVVRPVVRADVPRQSGLKQFVSAILGKLGYPTPRSMASAEIIARIAYLCEEMRVEVMLLDEAHHLVNPRNVEAEENNAEFLKGLLNVLPCQVVMAGLPRLMRLKLYNQTARRMDVHIHLKPASWRSVQGRAEFCATLAVMCSNLGLETTFDLENAFELSGEDLPMRFYCATGGHFGLVSMYLSRALVRSRSEGRRVLDLGLLADVHDDFSALMRDADFDDIGEWDVEAVDLSGVTSFDCGNPFRPEAAIDVLWKEMKARRASDYEHVPDDMLKGARTLRRENSTRVRPAKLRGPLGS